MATSQQTLVRDNSTLANFKQWAQAISNFFTTAGWLQSGDTGQVNWSSIAAVPAVNTFVYEIWQPNDGLTNFYLKVEYGTNSASSNTAPQIRMNIGTATNGAGTLSGITLTAQSQPTTQVGVTSTSTQWQCYFSGDSGRMCIMMWRDDSSGGVLFVVQRSLNSSGTPNSTYVTLCSLGNTSSNSRVGQQSLVFGVAATTATIPSGVSSGAWCYLADYQNQGTSQMFNGSVAVSPVFPVVGYFDNPMDALAIGSVGDFTEGATYTMGSAQMPYGVAHTYIVAKGAPFNQANSYRGNAAAVLMRFD
jgi:hypothetical protein